MQPLRKEDVFTGGNTRILDNRPWAPRSESNLDTIRGLLMAGALGLPTWAGVILLCLWIWP